MKDMKEYKLNAELLGKVTDYLMSRPYREVQPLVESIIRLVTEQNNAEKEASESKSE